MSLFLNRISCPICESKNIISLLKRNFKDKEFETFLKLEPCYSQKFWEAVSSGVLNEQCFNIVRCEDCSFIFQKFVLNNPGMELLYDKWLDSELVIKATSTIVNIEQLTSDYHSRLDYVTSYFKKQKIDLLDWGAGLGKFCSIALEKKRFNVVAYDYSNEKNKEINLRGIVTKTLNELENERFDFINVDQVLEHVVDPIGLINLCKTYLHDDGLIFISTPNCAKLEKIIKTNKLSQQLHHFLSPYQHVNAFTNKGMLSLAKRTALKPVFQPFMQIRTSNRIDALGAVKNLVKPFYRQWHSTSLFFKKDLNI